MKYAFIVAERATFPVRRLCRLIGVAASAFYAWLRRGPTKRLQDEVVLVAEIHGIFEESGKTYGSPRIHAELRARGCRIGRKRVARLMREHSLVVLRKKRRQPVTTDSRHGHPIAPNLLEQKFETTKPNATWLADITYVATGEGWLYVAAIKDMATREIVGWAMDDHLRAELCERALLMAIQRRQPPKGLIHHSDRGVQYASTSYQKILKRHGLTSSMSRKGNCLDNAPMESFFGSMKNELVHRTRFATREDAKRALFWWIESFYNRRRRHSALGYMTPAQAFEKMTKAA